MNVKEITLPVRHLANGHALADRLCSTPHAVRHALLRLREALTAAGLSPEDLGTVELALAEALNNIVEHAYRGRADGWITIEIAWQRTTLRCLLQDGGRAMPGLRLPPPGAVFAAASAIEDLPEGGFGWQLLVALTQNRRYGRSGGRNHLAFEIRLQDPLPTFCHQQAG